MSKSGASAPNYTDTELLDGIERLARESCEVMFPGEPCGFLVDEDGDVLSGTVGAGYYNATLREAIIETLEENRRFVRPRTAR